ncbi:MAG TPA: cobalamin-independent methionine synthase II family protein [Candidatus Sulfotelmatobacter sp.]|nr:cobalamin-independent methionine synthase II family protein [Candidatus Sulfotelmatobacter sp.]
MTLPTLPLLPTAVIGSHGQPGWMWLTREAIAQGRLGPIDRQEAWEDATRLALADMTEAGLDVIATGEMGRASFIVGFYERLRGIRNLEQPRRLGVPHWDTNVPLEVVDRISAPNGLGVVEEFRMARRYTDRPMKATVPGPFTLCIPLKTGGPYKDRGTLMADLVGIVNAEVKALGDAGADFIQIDEPNFVMYRGDLPDLVQVFNEAVEGVKAKLALHVCFGNLNGRPFPAVRSYRHLFPALHGVRADQLVLEFANRELADVGLWKEFPSDKELGAGVIDVKSFKAEAPEDVAARIREVLKFVRAERLWINPDCGFFETPRWIAVAKLRAMVAGARIVRKELGAA